MSMQAAVLSVELATANVSSWQICHAVMAIIDTLNAALQEITQVVILSVK